MPTSSRSASGKQPRRTKTTRRRSTSPSTTIRSGARPPVEPETVHLEKGAGGPGRGGDPGGTYWHIYVGDTRAGHVYINLIDEPPIGQHTSIQIQVNQSWQGRGVGREAYRLASESSSYDTVYAHMRKSNIGSRKAAEYAGYTIVENPMFSQFIMVWKRSTKRSK